MTSTTATTLPLSMAASSLNRSNAFISSSSSSHSSSDIINVSRKPSSPRCSSLLSLTISHRSGKTTTRGGRRMASCEVAAVDTASSSVETEPANDGGAKIGARVRVKVPLKVYHVPRVPEIDLTGMEGVLKQYVALWKGKHISANLPYKVEFFTDVEGRGRVKFFAHLKDDEFEYLP